jgi:hypothetical protein
LTGIDLRRIKVVSPRLLHRLRELREFALRSALTRFSVPALAALALLALGMPAPGDAASGPFAHFTGSWSGSGTIRPEGSNPERIRCRASFQPLGSDLDAKLRCASDSYNFDLTGHFSADRSNTITGRWTENSRGVGGTAAGSIRGDRIQVVVDAAGFSATLLLNMHGRRCDVTISSQAGGQPIKATIGMNRS